MNSANGATQLLFFPLIKRRAKYSSKSSTEYYSYRYYRENFQHEIAEDCQSRCVYCDSLEIEAGGREQMQLDHFRPYTHKGFENLEDDPNNFHHACGRCNLLKSDKWPSSHPHQPHDGVVGFIDPFVEDRRCFFSVDKEGELKPLRPPAEYLIRVLALNRPHFKLLRQRRIYQAELRSFIANNVGRWEDAINGRITITKETFEELAKDLMECKRLCDLCSPC